MSYAMVVRFREFKLLNELFKNNDTALSNESREIHKESKRFAKHYLMPMSRQDIDCLTKFCDLKYQWEADTAKLSSITEIAMHPAYQQIIGMGQDAIPLILAEMKRKPGHWFWALKSITGDDPVLPAQRGRVKEMTKAWLNWGVEQGYIYA
jgi:hypothetical protein